MFPHIPRSGAAPVPPRGPRGAHDRPLFGSYYFSICNVGISATCDFGPDSVISCERALFFVYIWKISWDATNRSIIQR